MKNKKLVYIIAGIILFIYIVLASYVWYLYFYRNIEKTVSTVAELEISLSDDKMATVNGGIPMSDEEGLNLNPYKFSVKNNSDVEGKYEVLIEEKTYNSNNAGKLLDRSQLRYQLSSSKGIVNINDMANISGNIIDARIIRSNETINYELRIWIPETAMDTDWMDRNYSYHIVIKPLKEEI